MIELTPFNFLIYFSIAWGTNISLNLLYVINKYFPRILSFDKPVDGGLKYRGDRLIGKSATVVSFFLCLFLSTIIYFIFDHIWAFIPILVFLGQVVGSFVKRRMHKKDGEFVLFVDHGDYMIITGSFFVIFGFISIKFALLALILTYILHPIACIIAFKLGMKEHPY